MLGIRGMLSEFCRLVRMIKIGSNTKYARNFGDVSFGSSKTNARHIPRHAAGVGRQYH